MLAKQSWHGLSSTTATNRPIYLQHLSKADEIVRFLHPMNRFIPILFVLLLVACGGADAPVEPVAVTDVPTVTTVTEQVAATSEPVATSADLQAATPEPTATVSPPEPTTEAVVEITPSAEFATSLPLIVNESPVLAQSLQLTEIADGLEKLVYLTHAGDDRLFTVAAQGRIYVIENGTVLDEPFLDIADRVDDSGSEQGLLSVAFHPDYANNNRFFVYYTGAGGSVIVAEFSGDGNAANENKERVLLTVPQPFRNHNGGQLQFGDDGYLYIGLGDGGSGGDPENNGQNPQTLLGSILRIDVDNGDPYAIPSDNPFVGDTSGADEVWTYGWRNPWRFSFDRATGDMYIGDVGQNVWEEISFESAESTGGGNYGWNVYEGTHCYINNCENLLPDAIPPILEYDHSEGCSITGGYVYRGADLPALDGNYFFADFCAGTIWSSTQPNQMQVVLDAGYSISSFGEDARGELYVLDIGGVVYKIVGSD